MTPAAKKSSELTPVADVQAEASSRILVVRGQRVVLDSDLAEFYGVRTGYVTAAVARNPERFPEDFAFRLTAEESVDLKTKNSSSSHGGRRNLPLVFTEQGALAVSGVLKSERAAEVSVAVARAFVAMRDQLAELQGNPVIAEFTKRLAKLEKDSADQKEFNKALLDSMRNFDSFIELVGEDLQDQSEF